MTDEQRIRNLTVPTGVVDAVLDTDAFNEVDDQFAISYFIKSPERIHPVALYAAPYNNENSEGYGDGMERSYRELGKLLSLAGRTDIPYFRGSETRLPSESEPVPSDAARDLAERASHYSPEHPLYVVSIASTTNIASALLMRPSIAENIVFVWLGGDALAWPDTKEFNLVQDLPSAKVIFDSGVPIVQLPCKGVVDVFRTTAPELTYWLRGKNPLADHLVDTVLNTCADRTRKGEAWSRVIWDVTAVAWLLNDHDRFLDQSYLIPTPIIEYSGHYGFDPRRPLERYIAHVNRDNLFTDLFRRLIDGN